MSLIDPSLRLIGDRVRVISPFLISLKVSSIGKLIGKMALTHADRGDGVYADPLQIDAIFFKTMQYLAIATDYDGTLATKGAVDASTLASLQRYREAGGQLLLVTGRELADLQQVFPHLSLFDGVIAENGAVYFDPASQHRQLLGEPFPRSFFSALSQRQVDPLHQGQVMISTLDPHGDTVQQVIQELALPARVILNKGAVMILPKGVDKGTGVRFALQQMGIPVDQAVGIGDAENDRDLLLSCGLAVAVENALTDLKTIADRVTTRPRGAGVQELIDWILSS